MRLVLTVMQRKVGRERTGDASCVDGDAKKSRKRKDRRCVLC